MSVVNEISAFASAIIAREAAYHDWLTSQSADPDLWARYRKEVENTIEKRVALDLAIAGDQRISYETGWTVGHSVGVEDERRRALNTPSRIEVDGVTIDFELGIYIEIGGSE